eukprot:358504-Chlamydomonas_euryale.AAC.11
MAWLGSAASDLAGAASSQVGRLVDAGLRFVPGGSGGRSHGGGCGDDAKQATCSKPHVEPEPDPRMLT